jgi:hypothetical protein
MPKNNLLNKFSQEDIKQHDTISLCVDIRNSTRLHDKFNDKALPAKIVATFISKCYLKCEDSKVFNNYIYAGDGLIAIALADNNKKAFKKVLDAAIAISDIIDEFNKEYSIFNAGIGIAFDKTVKIKVKNLPKSFNNQLYVGDSVAISSKICSSLPLKNSKYPNAIYIGMNKAFANNLPNKNKLTKVASKYIYTGD